MIDFTTIIGLDLLHVRELECVVGKWREWKSEIFKRPLLAVCDGRDPDWWRWRLRFLGHDNLVIRCAGDRPVEWSQREHMLTSITRSQATVETDWFLKIDTDTHATKAGRWIDNEWFRGRPAFVSPPWGYTKPASMLIGLERWAKTVSELASLPSPLPDMPDPEALVKHARIISWIMFGSADFARRSLSLVSGDRLPCPSQDTFAWYVAARLGLHYLRVNMKRLGWVHRRVKT